MQIKTCTSIILSVLSFFLVIFIFCTGPVEPDFTAPVIENDKKVLTYGYDIIDSTFGMYIWAKGTAPLSFKWFKDGYTVSTGRDEEKSDTLKFSSLALSDSGVYQCVVSNSEGTDSSLLCTLSVSIPPEITEDPHNASVFIGDTAVFNVTATGTKLSYQWQKDNVNVTNAKESTYTIPAETVDDDSTEYRCIVSNRSGKDTSETAVLTIRYTYTVTYDGNGNTGGSVPEDVNAYETGAAVTVLGNTGNLTRKGYTFLDWNTKADGSGISYPANTVFTMGKADVTLYAQWTANPTYKVTYDGNGNTGGDAPLDNNRYETGTTVTVLGNTGNLVKTGYTFIGWNTRANGTGISYPAGVTFTIGNADVTLYGQWTDNPTYQVIYDGNGHTSGDPPVDENNYKTGYLVIVLGNSGNMVKTGNVFLGWNTSADGSGTTYMPGQFFNIGAADYTLYALWTENPTYTVIYDANGATSGNVPVDLNNYETGDSVTVKDNTGNLEREGYTFNGWNTAEDGSGKDYEPESTFIIDSVDVTLYAKWVEILTYTVTYDGNGSTGGSVPVDVNSYVSGATVTVMGNTGSLVKTGSTFTGWNTKADGSGISYLVGVTFTIDSSDVTLYAKWTQDSTFNVVYDDNGATSGTVPVDVNNYEEGETVTVKSNTGNLVKDNFTFIGWNTKADGSGTGYRPGDKFKIGVADVPLYASWTENPTFNVIYNENGATSGKVPVDANNYEEGEKTTVLDNTGDLVKTGNIFSDWNTAADGSGTDYAYGDTVTLGTEDFKLYAKWIKIEYTVTFNSQGGSAVDSQIVSYGDTATTPQIPTKKGYTFAGWFREPSCINQWHFSLEPVTSDITLYAKWIINQYTVSYDGNEATGGDPPSVTTHDYNSTVIVKGNTGSLVKTGNTFSGWNTESDGSGTTYNEDSTFTISDKDVTLYAMWTVNQYNVTYDGNGNTGGTAPDATSHDYNSVVTVSANSGNLTKTGYSFSCWNTSQDGTGTNYTAGTDTFTIGAADVTLYAKWRINQYTVTYDGNGNTDGDPPAVTTHDYNSTVTVQWNTGTLNKTGYTFTGWNTEADGSGTNYTEGSTFTMGAADITLYAKWIVVDADGNVYTTVTIGTQVWLIENLKTTKYNDGSDIPLVENGTEWGNLNTPGYCWYDNDEGTYKEEYGALYNWHAVNAGNLAPTGWHVPSDDEWTTLINYLGGAGVAGGKMKETGTTHWNSPNTGATNESRFTALPGGYRDDSGAGGFLSLGTRCHFWSSTEDDATNALCRKLLHDGANVLRNGDNNGYGFSVRCVRDY